MDNLPSRDYTSLRSWSRPSGGRHGVYGNVEPTKPLSKLDSARLKLSKFKLKYGKQERQEDSDSSLSIESEERLSETPLNDAKLMVKDHSDVGKSSGGGSTNSSGKITDDSLIVSPQEEDSEKALKNRRLSHVNMPTQSDRSNFGQQQLAKKSPSDSSLSEISENVHSFSSLLKSEAQDDSIHATDNEKEKIMIPVPRVEMVSALERAEAETNGSSIISSISSKLQSAQEIVHMASLLASTGIVSHSPEMRATQSSDPSLHRDQQEIPVTRISSSTVDSVSSKLESSKETSSASSIAKYSSSDKISSVTLAPDKKAPRERRNAKVQTDTKRSRHVQVDLSWTESEYERRSCPVLRASSLPPGLRLPDDLLDECLEIIGVEDAVQVLLKSQLRLTLGLLQREQSLYINSCSAAARLERGYRQHTLADTRKFIRREKGLRGKLRRDAKLEKEGTALLRKQ